MSAPCAVCPKCQLQRLEDAAQAWLRTPFVAHARIQGFGVDCVGLALACYQASGLLPESLELPAHYPLDGGHHLKLSWVEQFIEDSGFFVRIAGKTPQPGDLLALRLSAVSHHVAITLSGGRILHAFENVGVTEGSWLDPSIARSIRRVYRPKTLMSLSMEPDTRPATPLRACACHS